MNQSLRERLEAARRRLKESDGSEPAPPCNFLFLSDVHIGEYIKEHSRIEFLKRNTHQDRDLCDLLEHYASHKVDGKPWRLVIGGDFLDFLTVTVTPSRSATAHHPELKMDDEEETFGLDTDEDKAVWKLERIVDRHNVLFAYLADFVGRGHYLEMLYGNHDAEFYWPRAKQTFVKLLTNIYFGSEQIPGASEADFAGRIRWHEWFYLEKGKFYVEHGNQYDDFSSFQYRLNPVVPFKPRNLDMPASHMIIRYFVNRLHGFRTHNKDNWTLWDFVSWAFKQGWSRTQFIVAAYVGLTRRLLAYAKIVRFAESAEIERAHRERLTQEAERYAIDPEVVEAIDNRKHPPVHESLGRIIQGMTLDLQAQGVIYLVLLIVVLLLPGWTPKLVGLAVWIGLVVLRKRLLKLVRTRFLGGEITTVIAPKLDDAAVDLAELLDVRYVLFGHTHKPMIRQVKTEPARWYLNTGCWLPPKYKERHEGGCRSPLTYAVILDRAVPEAKLKRWCQRNNRPEPFLAHLTAEADVPEITEIKSGSNDEEYDVPPEVQYIPRRPTHAKSSRRSGRPSLRKRRF